MGGNVAQRQPRVGSYVGKRHPGDPNADVNKINLKDKFASVVFKDFKICLQTKKKLGQKDHQNSNKVLIMQ